jgi:hypothetical protein
MTYPIQVYWSDEDRAWIADVPTFPIARHMGLPHTRRLPRLRRPWRPGWKRREPLAARYPSRRCGKPARDGSDGTAIRAAAPPLNPGHKKVC